MVHVLARIKAILVDHSTVKWVGVAAVFAAVATIPALFLTFAEVSPLCKSISSVLNWIIYLIFAVEAVVLTKVYGFRHYCTRNRIDIAILLFTFPIMPNALKGLWVLRLLRLIDAVPGLLGHRYRLDLLYYALVVTFFAAFGGGLAFSHYEDVTVFDSFYWASTTLTSVGYGDISPATIPGKIIAISVQWCGAVVLALLIGEIVTPRAKKMLTNGEDD